MRFEHSDIGGGEIEKHKDLDSLYEKIHEEVDGPRFDLNKRSKFVLKVNGQFVAKNDSREIAKGRARYVIQDSPFFFLREIEAQDAKRYIEANKGIKARAEEIY